MAVELRTCRLATKESASIPPVEWRTLSRSTKMQFAMATSSESSFKICLAVILNASETRVEKASKSLEATIPLISRLGNNEAKEERRVEARVEAKERNRIILSSSIPFCNREAEAEALVEGSAPIVEEVVEGGGVGSREKYIAKMRPD